MIFNKPNSWNGAETSNAHRKVQVGTANGTTDEILLPFDLLATDTITSSGTAIPTLDDALNKITLSAGTIYNIVISNAGGVIASYKVNEGSGVLLTDLSGNSLDATLSIAAEVDFWANKATPQEILDMDAGIGFFVDQVTGEPLKIGQDDLENSTGVINNNRQYYFSNCSSGRELLKYKEQLTLAEDEDAKISICLIEPVTYNGEPVTYNGEIVYGPIL